jgi:hypothetical protein
MGSAKVTVKLNGYPKKGSTLISNPNRNPTRHLNRIPYNDGSKVLESGLTPARWPLGFAESGATEPAMLVSGKFASFVASAKLFNMLYTPPLNECS